MNQTLLRVMRDIAELHRDQQRDSDIPLFAQLDNYTPPPASGAHSSSSPEAKGMNNASSSSPSQSNNMQQLRAAPEIRVYAMTVGPPDTPYANCFFSFLFDVQDSYPNAPPKLRFLSTDSDRCRLNPNLYQTGKVCLSVLGTWAGHSTETWRSAFGLGYVMRAVQATVLTAKPFYNEPGFEEQPSSPSSEDGGTTTAGGSSSPPGDPPTSGKRRQRDIDWTLHSNRYNQKVRHEALRIGVCQWMEAVLGEFDPLTETIHSNHPPPAPPQQSSAGNTNHNNNNNTPSTKTPTAAAAAAAPPSSSSLATVTDTPLMIDNDDEGMISGMTGQAGGASHHHQGEEEEDGDELLSQDGGGITPAPTMEYAVSALHLHPHHHHNHSTSGESEGTSPQQSLQDSATTTAGGSQPLSVSTPLFATTEEYSVAGSPTFVVPPPPAAPPQSTSTAPHPTPSSAVPGSAAAAAGGSNKNDPTTNNHHYHPSSSLSDALAIRGLEYSDRIGRIFLKTAAQFAEESIPLFRAFYDSYMAEVSSYLSSSSTTTATTSSGLFAAVSYPPATTMFTPMPFESHHNHLLGHYEYARTRSRLEAIWQQLEAKVETEWIPQGEAYTRESRMEALTFLQEGEAVDAMPPIDVPGLGLQVMVSGAPVDPQRNAFLWNFVVAVQASFQADEEEFQEGADQDDNWSYEGGFQRGGRKKEEAGVLRSEIGKQWLRNVEGCVYSFTTQFHPSDTSVYPRVVCNQPIGHPQVSPVTRVPLLTCFAPPEGARGGAGGRGGGAANTAALLAQRRGSTPLAMAKQLQQLFAKGPQSSPVMWANVEAGRALFGASGESGTAQQKAYLREVRRMAERSADS